MKSDGDGASFVVGKKTEFFRKVDRKFVKTSSRMLRIYMLNITFSNIG